MDEHQEILELENKLSSLKAAAWEHHKLKLISMMQKPENVFLQTVEGHEDYVIATFKIYVK